ncbi:flagellar motor switch protein FliN [Herbaspirillum autotrophicum]|uniref:flagellar motor switch protein FliN n=1 Tax=Herbaspirillum autotrophicum TaxID=180195 RepID=UPI00067E5B60|nr:flagellar motor switch protein FliN [Herbaspirillum autotrophicum]
MAEDNVDQTAAEDDPWGAALAEQTQAEDAQKKAVMDDEEGISAKPAQATIFKDLSASDLQTNTPNDIDFILDIPVQLTVELGRTKIAIKNLLQLAQGSVVELDGMAGEPMDVLVNGCLIAQGEVVVVNDKFGIRLTDIITPAERIRKLNR